MNNSFLRIVVPFSVFLCVLLFCFWTGDYSTRVMATADEEQSDWEQLLKDDSTPKTLLVETRKIRKRPDDWLG